MIDLPLVGHSIAVGVAGVSFRPQAKFCDVRQAIAIGVPSCVKIAIWVEACVKFLEIRDSIAIRGEWGQATYFDRANNRWGSELLGMGSFFRRTRSAVNKCRLTRMALR